MLATPQHNYLSAPQLFVRAPRWHQQLLFVLLEERRWPDVLLRHNYPELMSVPTPKASDAAKSQRRVITLVPEKNAPLRVVKELLRHTGILQVEGNFEFLDFAADCPSPLPMWTGGCRFRVPPAPSAEEEPKPLPNLTLSLDKEVRRCNRI